MKIGIESEEFEILLNEFGAGKHDSRAPLIAYINSKLLESKREERERCAEVCDECDDVGDPVYMCSRLIRSLHEGE